MDIERDEHHGGEFAISAPKHSSPPTPCELALLQLTPPLSVEKLNSPSIPTPQFKAVLAVTVVSITGINSLIMRWRPMTEDEEAWYEGHHLPGQIELAVELDEELKDEIEEFERKATRQNLQVAPVMPAVASAPL